MADVAKMLDTGLAYITAHPAVDIVTEEPRKLSDLELETIKAALARIKLKLPEAVERTTTEKFFDPQPGDS